jgi:hypothetical protein
MGKLHKIRKAILANPESFSKGYNSFYSGASYYHGCKQAQPSYYGNSYKNFVRKVLAQLSK